MTIYGEYLFMENFITGAAILFFTGKIAGEDPKVWRILLCGIYSGMYAFTMFMTIHPALAIFGKLFFVILVSRTAFGFRSAKRLLLNGVLFFAVTFLFGGITIGLLSSFQWEGVASAEGVYLPAATYLTVFSAGCAAALFIWLVVSLLKTRRQEERTEVSVTLQMGERSWDMEGFVDSGNFLREPFTGKPVAVVRRSVMEEILQNYGDKTVRYMAIPYRAVGTERGVMDGYRIDMLIADGRIVKKPVLAVCRDEEFLQADNDRGQILLPQSMLERGIYGDLNEDEGILSEAVQVFRKKYFLHRGQRCPSGAAQQGRGAENA